MLIKMQDGRLTDTDVLEGKFTSGPSPDGEGYLVYAKPRAFGSYMELALYREKATAEAQAKALNDKAGAGHPVYVLPEDGAEEEEEG